MSTNDLPGANPINRDKLARGAWAEHEDGSLIYVKDIDENGRVIFEIYDLSDDKHPIYYPHALSTEDFNKSFSWSSRKGKTAKTDIKWTWHDKTQMPWERVMRVINVPVPVNANVVDTLSAARRIAESLNIKIKETFDKKHLEEVSGVRKTTGGNASKSITTRLKNALNALVG